MPPPPPPRHIASGAAHRPRHASAPHAGARCDVALVCHYRFGRMLSWRGSGPLSCVVAPMNPHSRASTSASSISVFAAQPEARSPASPTVPAPTAPGSFVGSAIFAESFASISPDLDTNEFRRSVAMLFVSPFSAKQIGEERCQIIREIPGKNFARPVTI